MAFSDEQQVQDDFYDFPYHYCVRFKDYFSFIYLFDWGINYASAVEFFLNEIEKNKDKKSIIDIGCGEGRLTRELSLKFPDLVVDGVDYSEKPIQLAKALNSNINANFIAANIIEDTLDRKYDVATLMEVYEHIEPKNGGAFLKGVANTLNEDGVLHITVPHQNIPIAPHHFRHFSVELLTSEIAEYFDILEVVPFEQLTWKRKWMLRLLANKFFILNSKKLTTKIYNYYKKNMFFVKDESQCQRIYLKCRKKKTLNV